MDSGQARALLPTWQRTLKKNMRGLAAQNCVFMAIYWEFKLSLKIDQCIINIERAISGAPRLHMGSSRN